MSVLKEVTKVRRDQVLRAELSGLELKLLQDTATDAEKARYMEIQDQLPDDSDLKKGKYKLGTRTELKEHNKNGKVAYTTTLTKENYCWLKERSCETGKSGSVILNGMLEEARKDGETNEE